ncbi:MAG: hypothetical protein ACFB22_07365 [Rhodothalassiaceae bacterium]
MSERRASGFSASDILSVVAELKSLPQVLAYFGGLIAIIALGVSFALSETGQIILFLAAFVCVLVLAFLLVSRVRQKAQPFSDMVAPETLPEADQEPYDAFISTPMAGFDEDDRIGAQRDLIARIIAILERECGLKGVFYAGLRIYERREFDPPDIALKKNFIELQRSRIFILIAPEKVSSSIYVEAGMALALRKPCLFFVKDRKMLPFLLQGAAGAQAQANLPRVSVMDYDTPETLIHLMRVAVRDLLDDKAATRPGGGPAR